MATVAVDTSEQQIQAETSALTTRVMGIVVTTAEEYESAISIGKAVADRRKRIVEFFSPMKRAAKAAHSAICDKETSALEPVEKAEAYLRGVVTNYRVQEQKRAEEVARAERARKIAWEEEKRLAEAAAEEAAGNTAKAEAIVSEPIEIPAVEVKAEVPKVSGIRKRVNWKWTVSDPNAVPRDWFILDEKAIGQHVRENKEKTLPGKPLAIPGITAYSEEDTTF